MSDWETGCDAIVTLLQANVPGLASATVHKYEPWDPEELEADGDRHLAVWPGAGEEASPLAEGAHEIVQVYQVMVWEDATVQASRRVEDPEAAKAFLQVQNDIRNTLYRDAHQNIDDSEQSWYRSTQFAQAIGQVRWFLVTLTLIRYADFG